MWKKNPKIKHTKMSKFSIRIPNIKTHILVLKLESGKCTFIESP